MNKYRAKIIAEKITNEQILEMFENAKNSISDWSQISAVNKGMTIGTSWNILAKDFDINVNYSMPAKTNMVWEFGKYLPDEQQLKQYPKMKNKPKTIVHQEPKF
ncbi:hypothetical protein [Polluticaenibacter yanchengensis]|uniref:Uncharacterized protein n=1 Tax=Polluticaenibacter yanchengensis TaxID=3014562 RepID=A0ABT4UIT0_9BACT|nr:hypothetical protein [Chitinophagaceae bacterium LY-5]